MRGSPSCVVAVRRSGVWRMVVGGVAAASLASLVAWVFLAPRGQVAGARAAVAVCGLATLAGAASLVRRPAAVLRWGASAWSFADLATPSSAPIPGELEVAIDLGSLLLLRFVPRDAAGRRSAGWIAVERRGLEREWHSFRCAAYSPRPAAGMSGAADCRLA